MRICVVGTGYVGLVVGACLADLGNEVICVDRVKEKIDKLNQGVIPIYEPGLEEIVKHNAECKRLRFSTDVKTGIKKSKVVFIAVGTPCKSNGEADLKAVEKKDTAKAADKLRNITGITKEESGVQGDKIVGGKIRTEAVKGNKNPAKSDVGKAGALLFGDQVIEAMGGVLGSSKNKLGNYITFLEIRGDDVLSVLSDQNNLKNSQLSDLYKPNQVDRESTAEGNAVMEYGNPNPKVSDLIVTPKSSNVLFLSESIIDFGSIDAGVAKGCGNKV